MKPEIIVYHDVKQLKRDFKLWNMFSYPANFKLEMPILTKEEVDYYNRKFQALALSCGCYSGKILMAGAMLAYAIGFFADFNPIPTPVHFLNICLFAVTGALVGKVIGLTINNLKLASEIRKLNKKIAARRPKKEKVYREAMYAMG